jgi:PRC-barrel domain
MINRTRTNPRISAKVDSVTNDWLLGTTSLIEDNVYDSGGRFLGEIEDILIDARTGCVRYAVLALGGFMGFGRKRFAVPWSAFTPHADYRRCIIDVTLMNLMALPVSQDDPWLRRGLPAASPLGRNPARVSNRISEAGAAEIEKTA